MAVKLKRAYEPASPRDGYRVLVERLWPRGVRKQDLAVAEWLKEVAPSDALRKWFGHDPDRWTEFQRRYHQELKQPPAAEHLRLLAVRASSGPLTLVFSARDTEHNNAVALQAEIERLARQPTRRPASR
jgi:uncharacterized protein YeaO (DUF488 family)